MELQTKNRQLQYDFESIKSQMTNLKDIQAEQLEQLQQELKAKQDEIQQMESRALQHSEQQNVSTEESEVQQFKVKMQNQAVEIKALQKQLQAKDDTIKKLIVQRRFAEADAERA